MNREQTKISLYCREMVINSENTGTSKIVKYSQYCIAKRLICKQLQVPTSNVGKIKDGGSKTGHLH